MSTKLVSMNLGVRLTLEVDGKIQEVKWSAVCPSHEVPQPIEALKDLASFLGDAFTREFVTYDVYDSPVKIAKPRKIKATPHMSHAEYNRRIQELGK